ncbi:MAG: hypothetical protein C3F13_16800 [Anaerolineales bacterium]|nr:MAG: hypothetical protein C3F13_16800 [Anaerolineales bacterium]
MYKCKIITMLMFILLVLSACKMQPTTAIANATPGPVTREQVLPTKPALTATQVAITETPILPTATETSASPTPTDTPAPQGLNPSGPYVMFAAHSGIWITNPDGSFATRLLDYDMTSNLDLHPMVSPNGDRLAMVVNNEGGLDLVMVEIPSGESETIVHLLDASEGIYDPISPNSFALYAIRDYGSIAWQPPDGRFLAFTGAIEGPTSDLYLYDTVTKKITQLTSGPAQAVLPVWSPDGQYILHFGVSWRPPFGGAIGGANYLDGVWAVRASDGEIITLPVNKGSNPHFLGWEDDTHYITYDSGECSSENLHTVDIISGEVSQLMEASFYHYIARSPVNGAILFSSDVGCPDSLGAGVFILPSGQADPIKLHDIKAWTVEWMPESGIFDAYPEGLFSVDGQMYYASPVYDKSFKPAISKQGYQAWEVIENFQGRVMSRVPGKDWRTIMGGKIDELIWDPVEGKTLLIALSNGSIYAATYPDFAPHQMSSVEDSVFQVLWTP